MPVLNVDRNKVTINLDLIRIQELVQMLLKIIDYFHFMFFSNLGIRGQIMEIIFESRPKNGNESRMLSRKRFISLFCETLA